MTTNRNRFVLKNGLPATITLLDWQQTVNFFKTFPQQKSSAKYLANMNNCILVTVNLNGEMVCLAYLEMRENGAMLWTKLRRDLESGRWKALATAFLTVYHDVAHPLGNPSARIIQSAIQYNLPPRITALLTCNDVVKRKRAGNTAGEVKATLRRKLR